MNQQNYFVFQNDDVKGQRIDEEMRDLKKVGEIMNVFSQNQLENLKNSSKYYNNNEKQKLTRITGSQANMMIYVLKSGLSFYYKDSSKEGMPILDVYVDSIEYGQYIKNLILK